MKTTISRASDDDEVEDALRDLCASWDDSCSRGQELTPEQLCPDDPALREALRERIERRRKAHRVPTPPKPEGPIPTVTGYVIYAELGRGGMGVVYRARQRDLNRVVALKMIRDAALAGPAEHARFLTEAKAVAALQHPGIVQIHDYGSAEGRPYTALEFCPGGTLGERLRKSIFKPEDAARLVRELARAVAKAHQGGIIHRDLKPANVLFTADGTAKISDFGLAKRLSFDETDAVDAKLTMTDQILGTPSYMAPEQTRGAADVTPAADVYSLGVILYECLTGRVPFRAAYIDELLSMVRTSEPLAPRSLVQSLPRDLETICLKCLEKEPSRRYANAQGLDDDLDRYLSGEPIGARRPSAFERGIKWVKRRPTLSSLAAMAMLATGLIVGLMFNNNRQLRAETDAANLARQNEAQQLELARMAEQRAKVAEAQAKSEAKTAEGERDKAKEAGKLADAARQQALADALVAAEQRGKADAALVKQQQLSRLADGQLAASYAERAEQLLATGDDREALPWLERGLPLLAGDPARAAVQRIRLTALQKQCPQIVKQLKLAKPGVWTAARPDGQAFASADLSDTVRIFSPELVEIGKITSSGSSIARVLYSPDGSRLLTLGDVFGDRLWDARRYQQLGVCAHDGPTHSAVFAAGGRYFVTVANRSATLWNLDDKLPAVELKHEAAINAVDVCQGGGAEFVVTVDDAGTARQWDFKGKLLHEYKHASPLWKVAVHPKGDWFATGDKAGDVLVWDPTDDKRAPLPVCHHEGGIIDLIIDPTTHALASTGADRLIRVHEPARTGLSFRLMFTSAEQRHFVSELAFAGPELMASGHDRTVRVWRWRAGGSRPIVLPHAQQIVKATAEVKARRVLTTSADGQAQLWELQPNNPLVQIWRRPPDGPRAPLNFVDELNDITFAPIGTGFATVGDSGKITIVAPGLTKTYDAGWTIGYQALFQPLNKDELDRRVRDYRADSAARRSDPAGDFERDALASWPIFGAFKDSVSNGINQVASTSSPSPPLASNPPKQPQPVKPPELATGVMFSSTDENASRAIFNWHPGPVIRGEFSRSGRLLATVCEDGSIRVWNVADRRLLKALTGHSVPIPGLARATPAAIWAMTQVLLMQVMQDTQPTSPTSSPVSAVISYARGDTAAPIMHRRDSRGIATFSADESKWLTIDLDGAAHVWSVEPFGELRSYRGLDCRWVHGAFGMGDRSIVLAGSTRVDVIDLTTGKVTSLNHGGPVNRAAFSPDGSRIATAGADGVARLWSATGETLNGDWRHSAPIYQVEFSQDGRRVLTFSRNEARVWDVATGEALTPPLRHDGEITWATLHPTGTRAASSGRDGTARVWTIAN